MSVYKTILFDVHQHPSHYNSSLKLARLLKNDGHKVLFLGTERFKEIVCEAGFAIINQESMSVENSIQNPDPKNISFIKKLFYFSFFNSQYYLSWKLAINAHHQLLNSLNIDVVFLDEDINHRWLWYKNTSAKVIVFSSKPYTGSDSVIPPFTSYRMPCNTLLDRLITFCHWKSVSFTHHLSNFLLELKTFGRNYFTFSKMHANEISYPFVKNLDTQHVFKWVFRDYNKIILMPEELEFPRKLPTNIQYVGQYADIDRAPKVKDLRYISVLNQYELTKNDSTSLIYCSLGTLTYMDLKASVKFFRKLVSAASKLPQFTFILSIGQFLSSYKLLPLPTNVFIFPKISQAHILPKCDLMINHGGMNSIMECIRHGVPQLVYPLSLKWDQNGNSARVQYHKLGLRGKLRNELVNDIIAKINFIVKNKNFYKEKLTKLNEAIDKRYTDKEVISIINSLM